VSTSGSTTPSALGGIRHQRTESRAHGALNLSILDGWWAEAFDSSNGFAIGKGTHHVSAEVTDRRDAESLYAVIEEEVVPTFYDCDVGWAASQMDQEDDELDRDVGVAVSADRMVMDYARAVTYPGRRPELRHESALSVLRSGSKNGSAERCTPGYADAGRPAAVPGVGRVRLGDVCRKMGPASNALGRPSEQGGHPS